MKNSRFGKVIMLSVAKSRHIGVERSEIPIFRDDNVTMRQCDNAIMLNIAKSRESGLEYRTIPINYRKKPTAKG
jgi:hypothetical protein